MEELIQSRYTEAIKSEVLKRYGIAPEELKELGGFESFIYEFARDGVPSILRVSHSRRYNANTMQGELDFLRYLREAGAGVCAPLPSLSGAWLEIIEDEQDGQFMAAAFEKAKGGHHREEWTAEFLEEYGATIGKLHRLSSQYQPKDEANRLGRWDAPKALNYDDFLKDFDAEVYEIFQANLATIRALPKTNESYGIIHQDAHRGNFFVHEGKIQLFDFADACYGYFVNDIAMCIFYAMANTLDAEKPEKASFFFQHFWQGYQSEFSLDKAQLAHLPYFFRLREIDLYAIVERDLDWRSLEGSWLINFMTGRHDKLLRGESFIPVDFSALV